MLRTRCDAIIAVVLVVILAAYGISLIIYYGSTEKPILQISEEHLHALIVDGNYSNVLMVALSLRRARSINASIKSRTIHACAG